ncbi:MAG TPA: hypothetical protein VNT50_02955 [Microbacterium sp.]|uniref:hypothetical protein n=1 Tax=Microbacterium sp. TaxID=51671 RepID=UPI002C49C032|nr:hypothetical protein [Microbacterium sp.]HWI30421.1 hypothetical protein [Microbacterium sp.]
MSRVLRFAAVALVALLAPGCAAAEPEVGPTEAPLPAGVSVEFMQLRADVAKRVAQVRVVNESDSKMSIARLVLEDDRFDGPAVRDRASEIPVGRTLDLTVQLPPSACEDEPVSTERASRVLIEYSTEDGAFLSTADLPDPLDVIPALHARECLLSDLERSTAIEFTGFEPSEPGQAATLTLTLTPTGGAASEILAIQSTNLLALGEAGASVDRYELDAAVAEGDTEPIVLDLPLVPFRCDPHAVQEDKRGTIFTLDVATGGQAGVVNVAAPEELKGELLAWVARWCGFGS